MKSGKWPSFSDKLVPPVNAVHCDRAILILYRRSPVTYQAVSEGRIENGRLYSNGENRDEQGAIQAKAVASNWKVFSRRENLQLHARCCNPKKAPTVLALSNSIRKYRYRANLIEGLLGNLFWDGLLRWRFPSHGLRLPVFALRFDTALFKRFLNQFDSLLERLSPLGSLGWISWIFIWLFQLDQWRFASPELQGAPPLATLIWKIQNSSALIFKQFFGHQTQQFGQTCPKRRIKQFLKLVWIERFGEKKMHIQQWILEDAWGNLRERRNHRRNPSESQPKKNIYSTLFFCWTPSITLIELVEKFTFIRWLSIQRFCKIFVGRALFILAV